MTADQAVAKPRDPGTFTVRVVDQGGAPVRAQVSLAVIDEAVYGVKADETPDPVRFFYRREYTHVNTTFSSAYYFTGYSGRDRLQLAGRRRRPFTLADFKGDKPAQPEVRKDFPDAIYWLGDLVTNAEGEAKVAVKYPDALTTWRLTARAITTDTRAGSTIARTTTTKDLIVRVVTPRFLTEGDDVVIPSIVHNYRPDARNARRCRWPPADSTRPPVRSALRRDRSPPAPSGVTTGGSPHAPSAPRASPRRRPPKAIPTRSSCRCPSSPTASAARPASAARLRARARPPPPSTCPTPRTRPHARSRSRSRRRWPGRCSARSIS